MTDTEKPIQIPRWFRAKDGKTIKNNIPILVLVSEKEKLLLSPLGHYANITTHQQIPIASPSCVLKKAKLILAYQADYFADHVIAKLELYRYLGADNPDTSTELLKVLGLPISDQFPLLCKRILNLPSLLLNFCSEKRLGFKTLCYYAQLPLELIKLYESVLAPLSLSAQQLDKIFSHCLDFYNRNNKSLKELEKEADFQACLDPDLPQKIQIKKLLKHLDALLSPQHKAKNEKINHLAAAIQKDSDFNLSWDPALEETKIKISFEIKTVEDLKQYQAQLTQHNHSIKALLDAL